MSWIRSYDCITGAGNSSEALWNSLAEGQQHLSRQPRSADRPAFLFQRSENAGQSIEDLLVEKLLASLKKFEPHRVAGVRRGVILASTKGMLNDYVWNESIDSDCGDPLTPLLQGLLKVADLQAERAVCISHACSSALGALALAQRWLKRGLDEVLVVATDAVSPFVTRGFEALNLLTNDQLRPFDQSRNGFFLGDAAAYILLAAERQAGDVYLRQVGLDSEGSVVTRPQTSSQSVIRAATNIPAFKQRPPEIVFAHGTGTIVNDVTEDLAFAQLFDSLPPPLRPIVTGTKWCVGHTLGASGAIDLIAACEALKRQQLFRLATTRQIDSKFQNRYATESTDLSKEFSRVLVSSLGFGGMHASALVEVLP